VEAAGVELSSVLVTRKLLILGTATTAKKACLPDPLYVYCTKMLLALESSKTTSRPQYPIDSAAWIEKSTQLPTMPQDTVFPSLPARDFRVARAPLAIAGKPSDKPTCQDLSSIPRTSWIASG
jgi:hypothetical protein